VRARGLVVKSYSNFFSVYLLENAGEGLTEGTILETQLRGRFRQASQSVLTGDRVVVSVSFDSTTPTALIEEIEPRASELSRPPVANVDQVVLVFSLVKPELNWALLDRQLVLAEAEGLSTVMCLNKIDLLDADSETDIASIYETIGYRVVMTSAVTGSGVPELAEVLSGRITVLAGQSGVGKSTLINAIDPKYHLEMGEVTERAGRGRHTTRHVQLLELQSGGWVTDSPGFNYLELNHISSDELTFCFPEMRRLLPKCRFANCLHDHEPGCAVKEGTNTGEIHHQRYRHYIDMLEEIRQWEANLYR